MWEDEGGNSKTKGQQHVENHERQVQCWYEVGKGDWGRQSEADAMECKNVVNMVSIEGQRCGVNGGQSIVNYVALRTQCAESFDAAEHEYKSQLYAGLCNLRWTVKTATSSRLHLQVKASRVMYLRLYYLLQDVDRKRILQQAGNRPTAAADSRPSWKVYWMILSDTSMLRYIQAPIVKVLAARTWSVVISNSACLAISNNCVI